MRLWSADFVTATSQHLRCQRDGMKNDDVNIPTTPNKNKIWLLIAPVAFVVLFYSFCGFYSVPPIGALPTGGTAIVWRENDEPFFNSPDAQCLESMGGVSLLCRAMAMGQAPTDRILLRLPYFEWAYSNSVNQKTIN